MVHRIDSFIGGIRNKLDPAFLSPHEAVEAHNVNLDDGLLSTTRQIDFNDTGVQDPVRIVKQDGAYIDIPSSSNTQTKQLHARVYNTQLSSGPIFVTAGSITHTVPLAMLNAEIGYSTTVVSLKDSIDAPTVQDTLHLAVNRYNTVTGYESTPQYIVIEPDLRDLELDLVMLPSLDDGRANNSNINIQFIDTDPDVPVVIPRSDITYAISTGKLVYDGVKVLENWYLNLLQPLDRFGQAYDTGNYFKDFIYAFKLSGTIPVGLNRNKDDMFKAARAYLKTKPGYSNHDDAFMLVCLYGAKAFGLNSVDMTSMLEYLYENNIMTDFMDVYKYKYKQSYNSITLRNVTLLGDNEKVRIYRLGTFGKKPAVTQYSMQGDYNVPASKRITITDTESTIDSICPTLSQVTALNTDMFAVSTSNLWLADGHKLWYTTAGTLDIVETISYVSLPTSITGLHYVNNVLVVFCADNSIHTIAGTSRENIVLKRIADDIDCIDVRTITRVTQTLVWLSSDGLAISNGHSVQLLHRQYIKASTFNTSAHTYSAASSDDTYLLLADDVIYEYDLAYKRLLTHDAGTTKKLFLFKGDIWAHNGGTLSGKLFKGGVVNELHYVTGSIVKTSYTYNKEFQWFRVAYTGTPKFSVIIDGTNILVVDLPNATKLTHETVQVPQGIVGYTCQVQYDGICKIYSTQVSYNTREEQ